MSATRATRQVFAGEAAACARCSSSAIHRDHTHDHHYATAYVVVTLERSERLTLDDAIAQAQVAQHQGARVAIVPAHSIVVPMGAAEASS